MEKVGIIGAGNIGMAIAKGLISQKVIEPSQLFLSRKRNGLLVDQEKEGKIITDNHTLVKECEVIILAVLPGQAKEVVLDLKELLQSQKKLLISVVSAPLCLWQEWRASPAKGPYMQFFHSFQITDLRIRFDNALDHGRAQSKMLHLV